MALRGLMMSSDGRIRVHHIEVDGVQKLRIEKRGKTQALSGQDRDSWYHVHDARSVAEVARHVNLADLNHVND